MKMLQMEYHARKKEEKKSGGNGWESQRWKQDLLERASIAIAKGNYNMLRNNRTLPHTQPKRRHDIRTTSALRRRPQSTGPWEAKWERDMRDGRSEFGEERRLFGE